MALLSLRNGWPKRPENKPRRSQHKPWHLLPYTRTLPGAYPPLIDREDLNPGSLKCRANPRARHPGKCSPSPSRVRHFSRDPPERASPCPGQLRLELRAECGGAAAPHRELKCCPCPERSEGTTLPRTLCAEPGADSLALRDRGRLVLEQMSAEYLGESARRGERGAGGVPRPRKLCMR